MADRPQATRGDPTATGGTGESAGRNPQVPSTNVGAVGDRPDCDGDSAAFEAGLGDVSSHDLLLKKARTIACDRCRRARKRCDANKPKCSRCNEKGLDCSYTPSLLFYTTSSVTNGGDDAYTSVSPQQEFAPFANTFQEGAGGNAARHSNHSPQGFPPPLSEPDSQQLIPQAYNSVPHQSAPRLPPCVMVTSPVPTSSRTLSATNTIALPPTQRAISCEGCRQQKRKCDKVKPRCSLCIHRKIPCTYTITTKRSLDSNSAAELFPPVIRNQPPHSYSQQPTAMSYRPYPQRPSSWSGPSNNQLRPQSLQSVTHRNASDSALDWLNTPVSLPSASPFVSRRNASLSFGQISSIQAFAPALEDYEASRWRAGGAVSWDQGRGRGWSDETVGGPGGGLQSELAIVSHVNTTKPQNDDGEKKVTDTPEWLRVLLE